MSGSPRRARLSLTADGGVALCVVAGLGLLASATGNNAIYLLLAVSLSLLALAVPLGGWNLRGLEVARVLPSELFAGSEGRGAWVLRNRRRWGPAIAVEVEELDGGSAMARVGVVPPGREVRLPAGWSFPRRGAVSLRHVRICSRFPFGLAVRSRVVDLPAEVLVYPRPLPSVGAVARGQTGADEGEARGNDQGDFAGLRPYRPGDPPRQIHWPTSARTGELHVIQRAGGGAELLLVRVARRGGEAWERELARACGEVLRGFAHGAHVGLELPTTRFEARLGDGWRRTLLDALAREAAPAETP